MSADEWVAPCRLELRHALADGVDEITLLRRVTDVYEANRHAWYSEIETWWLVEQRESARRLCVLLEAECARLEAELLVAADEINDLHARVDELSRR